MEDKLLFTSKGSGVCKIISIIIWVIIATAAILGMIGGTVYVVANVVAEEGISGLGFYDWFMVGITLPFLGLYIWLLRFIVKFISTLSGTHVNVYEHHLEGCFLTGNLKEKKIMRQTAVIPRNDICQLGFEDHVLCIRAQGEEYRVLMCKPMRRKISKHLNAQ